MLMGTLKETLIFQHDDGADFHRYEIYKNELRGGYMAIVYVSKKSIANSQNMSMWEIASPFFRLKSNYLPNARV